MILQDGGPAAGVAVGPIATADAVCGGQSARVTDGRSGDDLATGEPRRDQVQASIGAGWRAQNEEERETEER